MSARVPPAGVHSSSTADRSGRCRSRSGKCIKKQFPRRIQRQEQLDVCAKMLLLYFLSAPEVIPNQTGARSAGFLRKFSKGCCRNGRSRQLLGMSLQFRQTVFRLNPPVHFLFQSCHQTFDLFIAHIGLPLNMDGTEGERARKSRKLAKTVEIWSGLPVRMWDERQTTCAAADLLDESGTFGAKRKSILDSVSATVILDDYIQWRKEHPGEV